MYKKCEKCYENGKTPSNTDCEKCEIKLDLLKAENEKYKKEIMSLRKGYDEEDCIETCPNMQVYEKEIKHAEQKLERIREKVQAYINDQADLTPEQVLQIIDEVE